MPKSHVAKVEKKLTGRALKAFLMGLASDEAKQDTLFETIINTVALNALSERGLREKGTFEMTPTRAAVMQAEGREDTDNLESRFDHLNPITRIFTPHPNWALGEEARDEVQKLYATLGSLSDAEWYEIANRKPKEALTKKFAVDNLHESLNKPARMTVADEWERTDEDAQTLLNSFPLVAAKLQRARESVEGTKLDGYEYERKDGISVDELEKYVGLVAARSWGLDRDSKPNVTAEAMEEEIGKQIKRTRDGHAERLKNIVKELKENNHTGAAVALQNAISEFEKGGSVENLGKILLEIKTQQKDYSKLPPFKDEKGDDTPFSILDMAYLQVKTAGECWPKGEIRQNAAMHATAMRYARKLLPESIKGGANNNGLLSELASNPSAVQGPINTEIDRLKGFIKEYNAFCKLEKNMDARDNKLVELGLTQEQVEFYETFAGLRVASKFPEAIHSYVIAETGVIEKEDFEPKVAARILDMRHTDSRRTWHKAIPKMSDEKVREMACNEVISEKVKEDLLAVMFMKYMNGGEDYKNKAAEHKMEIIPLFESFQSITQGWSSMDKLDRDGHFQDYIKNCSRNEVPKVTLPDGAERVMNIAEAKIALGMEPSPGDEKRDVIASITIMHAGSDAMRENGGGISPLNTHYQERVQEKLIEQGIWVEMYQGTGAAVHRSHPSSSHVARSTIQGGERHHVDAVTMAWQILTSIAVSIANRLGFTLPEKFHDVLASYPGHMGNSMIMPKESVEIKKATQEPLEAACKAHAERFEDPAFQRFFTKFSAFDYTKMFNFSARPDGRVGAFALDKVRAIGFSMSLFAGGSNNTLIGGMNEFFGMNYDNGYKMEDSRRDDIKEWLTKSPKIQEVMTRLTHAIATANMDTAWAFQGVERVIGKDGEVLLKKGEDEILLKDLLGMTKEAKKHWERDPFGIEAIALAEADKEYQTTAKAVYEIYKRMQIDLEYAQLVAKTPGIGGHHARTAKEEKLNDLEKELTAPYFDPKKIFEIMPAEMREELKEKMKPIDRARAALAQHHNTALYNSDHKDEKGFVAKEKLDELRLYRSFATCMEGFETGADACLRHTSRNFTSDVVLGKNVTSANAEYGVTFGRSGA